MKYLYFVIPLVIIQIICLVIEIFVPLSPAMMLIPNDIVAIIFGIIIGIFVDKTLIDD